MIMRPFVVWFDWVDVVEVDSSLFLWVPIQTWRWHCCVGLGGILI